MINCHVVESSLDLSKASESILSDVLENCMQYDYDENIVNVKDLSINDFVLDNSCANSEGILQKAAV